MTLKTYEAKLKSINPGFRVYRAPNGLVGLYLNRTYICRLPESEIHPHDKYRLEYDKRLDRESTLNPLGAYTWYRLLARGRRSTAKLLYEQKYICLSDVPKIS